MRRATFIPIALVLLMLVTALACNLSDSSAPPTIVPRATETPVPTIGYATLSPEQLPQQVTAAPQSDTALLSLLNEVDPDRLFIHIDQLQRMGTRHVNSPYDQASYGIGAAYAYILGEFQTISQQSQGQFSVFTQDFPLTWGGIASTAKNIIGVINGTEIGAGTIVVGAHYDSTSLDYEGGTGPAPGANDDASGISALIELARILSRRQHRSSIMFVAFSAEEVGRKGSLAFVNDYIIGRQIPVNAMFNMDMIGSQDGPDGSIDDSHIRLFSAGPNDSASRQLGRALDLITYVHMPYMSLVLEDAVDRTGRFGDHMSFSDVGYPAVRFVETKEDPGRNHNDRDTIDDIQATYLMRATQTVLTCVTAMADGPRPPRNISLRDNGDGTRTLIWEPSADAVSYVVALRYPGALVYDQFFETIDSNVRWSEFIPSRFAGVAIAAKDSRGMMGPVSVEYLITG